MTLSAALNIADLERLARARLPHGVYQFIAGGTEDDNTRDRNRTVFDQWRLAPKMFVDVSGRTLESTLFGHRYAMPLGIAPMGLTTICWQQADLALARAAASANLPFIVSGASTVPLEVLSANTPGPSWYQAYIPSDRARIEALAARLLAADYEVLVVTADAQIGANRENNVRTGFAMPFRLNRKMIAGGLTHPRWLLGTLLPTLLRSGIPHFENFEATRGSSIITQQADAWRANRDRLDWADMRWLRSIWPKRFVLKGILRADDARRAVDAGADGVIVSNHGGRQLDGALSSIEALPDIVDAVGDRLVVMVDSGIRRGTDVMKALALGAKHVFVGRPVLFGTAVGGEAGAKHALGILRSELDRDFGLTGCVSVADLDRSLVRRA